MLTRGRQANHLYLQVVGDGDPHTLVHTEAVYLTTAVERLEQMLVRDGAPESASTQLREQDDPARLLAPAVARYSDALGFAAEQVVGADAARHLDEMADQIVLWLTRRPAWSTLRADLLEVAADGHDPVALLRRAANMGDLDSAHDPAAVLDHRLHLLVPDRSPGPLPWLRGIPSQVNNDPIWGPYLQARAARVEALADAVRVSAISADVPPEWLAERMTAVHVREATGLVGDIATWRAALNVPLADRRPTGEPAAADAAARWQNQLDGRLEQAIGSQAGEWADVLPQLDPAIARDPQRLTIAGRLQDIERRGAEVTALVNQALAQGPLPDEHAASAFWWRVSALANKAGQPSGPPPGWAWAAKAPPVGRPESERAPHRNTGRDRPHLGY